MIHAEKTQVYVYAYFLCFIFPFILGTPEYLSPSTVRNRKCGVEVDLWALGIVLHQMLLGYTPYGAPSPYLTFLRIKRSFLQVDDIDIC